MNFAELISKATQAVALFNTVKTGLADAKEVLSASQYSEVKAKLDEMHAEVLEIGARIDELTAPAARS